MNTAVTNRIVDNYFRFIKNWDINNKKELIIKITSSIESKSKDEYDFSSCFGSWDDNRSADEIIKELRNDRVDIKEIEDI